MRVVDTILAVETDAPDLLSLPDPRDVNAALSLIGYFLLSIGTLVALTRTDTVPFWGTMAAGVVLAGLGVLFVLRRFTLDGPDSDGTFNEPPIDRSPPLDRPPVSEPSARIAETPAAPTNDAAGRPAPNHRADANASADPRRLSDALKQTP